MSYRLWVLYRRCWKHFRMLIMSFNFLILMKILTRYCCHCCMCRCLVSDKFKNVNNRINLFIFLMKILTVCCRSCASVSFPVSDSSPISCSRLVSSPLEQNPSCCPLDFAQTSPGQHWESERQTHPFFSKSRNNWLSITNRHIPSFVHSWTEDSNTGLPLTTRVEMKAKARRKRNDEGITETQTSEDDWWFDKNEKKYLYSMVIGMSPIKTSGQSFFIFFSEYGKTLVIKGNNLIAKFFLGSDSWQSLTVLITRYKWSREMIWKRGTFLLDLHVKYDIFVTRRLEILNLYTSFDLVGYVCLEMFVRHI